MDNLKLTPAQKQQILADMAGEIRHYRALARTQPRMPKWIRAKIVEMRRNLRWVQTFETQ